MKRAKLGEKYSGEEMAKGAKRESAEARAESRVISLICGTSAEEKGEKRKGKKKKS